jgi:hemolysin activation/secretion protein
VGGLYSVRGYDESLTAADTAFMASAEYRFHLPRVFGPNQEPGSLFGQTFKWEPQYVFGRPDWDLILKGFVDYGFTMNSKRENSFEDDHELLSTGVGVELMLKRNFSIRVDWGYVLKDVEAQGTVIANQGDSRFHIVGTILY